MQGRSQLGAQLAVGDELIEDVEGALAYNEKEVCGVVRDVWRW